MSWLVARAARHALRLRAQRGRRVAAGARRRPPRRPVAVGEKLVSSVRIRLHGTAGHASIPEGSDNPLAHRGDRDAALLAHQVPPSISPARRARSRSSARRRATSASGWPGRRLSTRSWRGAAGDGPDDVTPTGLATHAPANVIPPFADLICDCRALPGQGVADLHTVYRGGARRRPALRGRAARAPRRRHRVADRLAALPRARGLRRREPSPAPGCCRSSRRGSPTRTGSATPGTRWPTGSPRC